MPGLGEGPGEGARGQGLRRLGAAIRTRRARERLSIEDLSDLVAIGTDRLDAIEAGRTRPTEVELWSLAIALQVPMHILTQGEGGEHVARTAADSPAILDLSDRLCDVVRRMSTREEDGPA